MAISATARSRSVTDTGPPGWPGGGSPTRRYAAEEHDVLLPPVQSSVFVESREARSARPGRVGRDQHGRVRWHAAFEVRDPCNSGGIELDAAQPSLHGAAPTRGADPRAVTGCAAQIGHREPRPRLS